MTRVPKNGLEGSAGFDKLAVPDALAEDANCGEATADTAAVDAPGVKAAALGLKGLNALALALILEDGAGLDEESAELSSAGLLWASSAWRARAFSGLKGGILGMLIIARDALESVGRAVVLATSGKLRVAEALAGLLMSDALPLASPTLDLAGVGLTLFFKLGSRGFSDGRGTFVAWVLRDCMSFGTGYLSLKLSAQLRKSASLVSFSFSTTSA